MSEVGLFWRFAQGWLVSFLVYVFKLVSWLRLVASKLINILNLIVFIPNNGSLVHLHIIQQLLTPAYNMHSSSEDTIFTYQVDFIMTQVE